jgi:hypothetical protein
VTPPSGKLWQAPLFAVFLRGEVVMGLAKALEEGEPPFLLNACASSKREY